MTAQVLKFSGDTRLDIAANDVLEGAIDELDQALVVGYCKEDGSLYVATTTCDLAKIVLLLERAKQSLLMQGLE